MSSDNVFILFVVTFFINAILTIYYLINLCEIQRHLKKVHHGIWLQYGSPDVFFNNSISNQKRFRLAMKKGELIALGDERLNSMVKNTLFLYKLAMVACTLMFISFFGGVFFQS